MWFLVKIFLFWKIRVEHSGLKALMFHLFSWKFIKSYLQPMLMHSGVWRLMPQWQLCNKQEGWREQKISSIQCIRKSRAFFRNQKILIHAIWYLLFCSFLYSEKSICFNTIFAFYKGADAFLGSPWTSVYVLILSVYSIN